MYEPTPRVSVKAAQLADQLRDLAASFLQKSMPGEVVTVVRVTLSPDFHNATAWIRAYPSERAVSVVKTIEKRHLGAMQRALGQAIPRRGIPRIHIAIDQSSEMSDELSTLLG